MTSPTIVVERSGALGVLTLNRPDRLNAIDSAMTGALVAGMNELLNDDAVRAVLISGAGRAFCAGTDLNEAQARQSSPNAGRGGDALRDHFNPLIMRMVTAPKPIVAAINGPAAGVGCALALAADIVLAARSATFIQAFVRIGAVPDAGSSWLLPRLAGRSRAMAMMMLGEPISAERAVQWGIVHELHDDDVLASEAHILATRLSNGPTLAYAAVKRLVAGGTSGELEAHLWLEAAEQDAAFDTLDHREGVAAYSERRSPKFIAR